MSMHKELSVKSRVRGDFHERFCERVRVKLPRSTRPCTAPSFLQLIRCHAVQIATFPLWAPTVVPTSSRTGMALKSKGWEHRQRRKVCPSDIETICIQRGCCKSFFADFETPSLNITHLLAFPNWILHCHYFQSYNI